MSKSNYPLVLIGVFTVGLLLAGGLLYRWINRASIGDHEQQVEFLNAAVRSFRGEFIATLFEVRATFHPVPREGTTAALDEYLASFYSQWRSNENNAGLVSTFSVATLGGEGKVHFRTFDPSSGHFEQKPWPKSLQDFRPRIERINTHEGGPDFLFHANGFPFAIEGSHPVLVVPLLESGGRGRGFGPGLGRRGMPPPLGPGTFMQRTERVPAGPRPDNAKFPPPEMHFSFPGRLRGWCFLELNLNYLKQQLLPRFIERSFGAAGLAHYRVAVLTGNPPQVVYGSQPGLTASSLSSPDARALLFSSFGGRGPFLRAREWGISIRGAPQGQGRVSVLSTLRGRPPENMAEGMPTMSIPDPQLRGRPPENMAPGMFPRNHFREADAWVLVAKNKAGSIDAVVAGTRRRSLALGFGVLFVLAFSMGLLVITTHRARELARREMEFVAGVSHEFRTPLASIRSAGFNLASGVVRKSSRVQEYGSLVQNEARRLTDMIEQVMSYAGIQSGGKRYELAPTQVSGIIDRAVAEYEPTFREAGWTVEKKVEENLPLVSAEAPSVESAVKNLLANAVKYAGAGKYICVGAKLVSNNEHDEVQISVEDHGPGVDPADLPHIFEPFYRGQQVLASTTSGTGLGLSIVKRHLEAHGGRVSVESTKGQGTRFILHLPAIPASERKAV